MALVGATAFAVAGVQVVVLFLCGELGDSFSEGLNLRCHRIKLVCCGVVVG